MMTDLNLSDFLLARIAEDEAVAQAVAAANHREGYNNPAHENTLDGPVDGPAGYAAIWIGVGRLRAECEAKRHAVELHKDCGKGWGYCDDGGHGWGFDGLPLGCADLSDMTLPYADHPDCRDEWKRGHDD